jgi:hypothetical protein
MTADFGDEPRSVRYASAPNDHRRRVAPARTLTGRTSAKVAELTYDDCRARAYPTELIVQKSEQLGLMMNS